MGNAISPALRGFFASIINFRISVIMTTHAIPLSRGDTNQEAAMVADESLLVNTLSGCSEIE